MSRVSVDDFNEFPSPGDVDVHGDLVHFVTLEEFISVEEDTAEPLLGTSSETLLPVGGMMLMYGDGGAGKTTLTIDAVAHLGSGTEWLGVDVPRPTKITLVENEGPRGKFRQMLNEKTLAWNTHTPFRGNVTVLEEPWTRFTLSDDHHRLALATHVSQTDTDIVVMGPLATLGMIGGGTPDEISAFERLLKETRKLTSQPFAYWIVHHENKSGDVSGAWERVPDTLVHVQAQGNGHTRLVWRKARWSSENHERSLELIWEEGRSFSVVDKPTRDPWEETLIAYRKDDQWRTVKETAKLISISEDSAKKVLAELVRRGEMQYEIGPSGRHGSAHCYRLKGALSVLAHLDAPSEKSQSEEQGARCATPLGEAAASAHLLDGNEGAPDIDSAPSGTPSIEDDIPF